MCSSHLVWTHHNPYNIFIFYIFLQHVYTLINLQLALTLCIHSEKQWAQIFHYACCHIFTWRCSLVRVVSLVRLPPILNPDLASKKLKFPKCHLDINWERYLLLHHVLKTCVTTRFQQFQQQFGCLYHTDAAAFNISINVKLNNIQSHIGSI